jgi:hypothetical protein
VSDDVAGEFEGKGIVERRGSLGSLGIRESSRKRLPVTIEFDGVTCFEGGRECDRFPGWRSVSSRDGGKVGNCIARSRIDSAPREASDCALCLATSVTGTGDAESRRARKACFGRSGVPSKKDTLVGGDVSGK